MNTAESLSCICGAYPGGMCDGCPDRSVIEHLERMTAEEPLTMTDTAESLLRELWLQCKSNTSSEQVASLDERIRQLLAQPSQRQEPSIAESLAILSKAMHDDPGYAWTWHCNIAMVAQDAGAPHAESNRQAAGFMHRAFGVHTTPPEGFATPPPIEAAKVEVVEGWARKISISNVLDVKDDKWNADIYGPSWKQVAILRRADFECLNDAANEARTYAFTIREKLEQAEAALASVRAERDGYRNDRNEWKRLCEQITDERDALAKRIEDAPKETVGDHEAYDYGARNYGFICYAFKREDVGKRVALVVLEEKK